MQHSKCRHIISWALLLLFLLPSTIKLEHHHHEVASHASGAEHEASFHEKCAVCDFEFSFFSFAKAYHPQQVAFIHNIYVDGRNADVYVEPLKYSFSLRAPPVCLSLQGLA